MAGGRGQLKGAPEYQLRTNCESRSTSWPEAFFVLKTSSAEAFGRENYTLH